MFTLDGLPAAYHPSETEVLGDIARKMRPESYLEIGVAEGGSLVAFLFAAQGSVKRITLCDPWGKESCGSGRGSHTHIDILLKRIGYDGTVQYLDGDSNVLIPQLTDKFDVIFIDGDHSEKSAGTDLLNCWPLLNEGGYLAFDDTGAPALPWLKPMLIDFVKDHPEAQITHDVLEPINDPHSGVLISPNGTMAITKRKNNAECIRETTKIYGCGACTQESWQENTNGNVRAAIA
jgi:predicted O-methyltransferase YrrM